MDEREAERLGPGGPPSDQRGSAASGRSEVEEDFFEPSFLAELQELASTDSGRVPRAISSELHQRLAAVLATCGGGLLSEEDFVSLPSGRLAERTNALLEVCRLGPRREAVLPIESFIVFFQALVPTLGEEGSRQVKRLFFRLIPTLIHIAHNDFADRDEGKQEGLEALRNLERILIEIAGVRLTPAESELVFRSTDHLVAFISVAEYAMANDIISSQLLSIISRNRLTRALFRLMEVEVSIQRYLKERLGYSTPRLRLPEDVPALSDYGPLRVLDEAAAEGGSKRFVQVHLPHIPILRDIVLHLVAEDGGGEHELRLDALGSAELRVPDGLYALGLVYKPE